MIKNSADHPDDTYWFQGVGWLNPDEVKKQDGKTFLRHVHPEPELIRRRTPGPAAAPWRAGR